MAFSPVQDISDRSGDGTLSPVAKTALSAISIIGSIFSLIGCALTIITQLGFKYVLYSNSIWTLLITIFYIIAGS